jgi:uncharacterized protein YfbU (UPF0304 family)
MVVSKFYLTREDGVNLYRIYSDEGFEIQHKDTLKIFGDVIEDNTACVADFIEIETKVPDRLLQLLENTTEEFTH